MNLNNEEEDPFFNQHCLELAKLLRTEQTEHFLHLYDSLPSEWNGAREYLQLDTAKEHIRQLQELDEHQFELLYQRAFPNPSSIMSNLPQSALIRHNDNNNDPPPITTTTSRITSLPLLQQRQHHERITANNLACDETHDLTTKHSSSNKKNNDEFNTKTRRLQPITNNNTHDTIQNNSRTRTPVDSFVQLNLKPAIDIKVEDYKKARDTMSATKTNSTIDRSSNLQSIDTNESNQSSTSILKKSKTDQFHADASFDYFTGNNDTTRQRSRSSSSSSSTNQKADLSITDTLAQSTTFGHSKLIANNDFDSHGSSIATKSSSENSGSARTGSDSDDEHHQSENKSISPSIKSSQFSREKSFNNFDDTPTIVLNKISENRPSQHDRISFLPDQNSYELVKLNEPLPQVPRFKQHAIDDPNGINNSTHDFLTYDTQRPQENHLISSSSSHPNRNLERNEQYNPNHSNSSRKSSTRTTKKRKQSQQQDIIRTELIPGHRGDRDVDELVMFIDGNLSSKARPNSASGRSTDANSNSHPATSRRKSRKPTKILPDQDDKSSHFDEDTQSIGFIDDDTRTNTTTHSLTEQISLPDDDESHSNTTNGEISLPEWHSTSSIHDEIESLSVSSTILNNSNSEITSEPFVTVTHRRRSIKERRPDTTNNNNNNTSFRTSRFPDKRRFQPVQNGIVRPTISNNNKPSVSLTTKEDISNSISPPSVSQTSVIPSTSIANHLPEQSSPRLSSHSSSSSLSSLLKRQSKAPPVVFLNKSIDIELNDVSFGFDVENATSEKPPSPTPPPAPPIELPNENEINPLPSPRRSYQQRNPRGPLFYSGSDIRPQQQQQQQQHRTYPPQSSYIDPLVLLQYNQQRYQQLAYMNLLRNQYLSSQSPYVLIPTGTPYETNSDDKDEPSEPIQEPLLVYATIPGQSGPIYYQPPKKSFPSVYPSQYYYPAHPAYFQPIPSSSSLSMDNKSQQDETDNDEEEDEDNDLDKSTRRLEQTRQQSSSHIMSNALQLVYSQEKRNAQTDRFNLDQLTAYLAMKWTDTIDHYEQGDDEILLTSEQ